MKSAVARSIHPLHPLAACVLLLAGTSATGAAAHAGTTGLDLAVTVGTDLTATACGDATTLDVIRGDRVNLCYRVTNTTAGTLAYQALTDSIDGVVVPIGTAQSIAPGQTYQFNRVRTIVDAATHVATWTASAGAPAYAASLRAGRFIDISASPTATDLDVGIDAVAVNYGTASVTVPFPVSVYGAVTDQLCVSDFGIVGVARSGCTLAFDNNAAGALPAAGLGMALMPLWDSFEPWPQGHFCGDLCPYAYGAMFADTLGTAPNRQFVIQWNRRIHAPVQLNADGATFEVVFDEASGGFSFEYADVDYTAAYNATGDADPCDGGACATIGVQANDAVADQFSYLDASVTAGSGIDWVANPTVSAVAAVTFTVGEPTLAVAPAIAAGVAPGVRSTATLALANDGDRDLEWRVGASAQQAAPTGGAVPTFGLHVADLTLANPYVSFDLADPAAAVTVLSPASTIAFQGATFVDNDFSQQYVLDAYSVPSGEHQFIRRPVQLRTLDTTTGQFTRSVETGIADDGTVTSDAIGLAWDARTNSLFCVMEVNDSIHPIRYLLATLDRYVGGFSIVGEMTFDGRVAELDSQGLFAGVSGLMVDRDGVLWGVASSNLELGPENVLIRIDKATGASHSVSMLDASGDAFLLLSGGTAFDPSTNDLYVSGIDLTAGGGGIFKVDATTGEGTANPSPLDFLGAFAIATPSGPCVQPQSVPWLTVTPAIGTLAPGASAQLVLGVDATALPAGTYETDLCIGSNDPYRRMSPTHVTLRVGADALFADGFDLAARP